MEPIENKHRLRQDRIQTLLKQCEALAEIYFLNYDGPDKPLAKTGLMSILKSEVTGMTVDQLGAFEGKVSSALERPETFLAGAWRDEGHGLR